ncbi:MAG: glutamate--tRNA ligase [Bacteroidales bacterium]|nr:glutamate--tRNA ligase [Bacteroidales bacterium]MDZ4205359.1 glutamate--tRNA ligase [Bacteroidales bacterium]
MEINSVRVRFAPSPTGPLHIGGVRTALYNYLFARKHNGSFILRIEDTDQTRFVPGAEEYIIEALTWCGINFDEGVHVGGPYASYRQSERKEIYHRYAKQLVNDGFAYYAFDTVDEIEALRKQTEKAKEKPFQYDVHTRKSLKNSLVLDRKTIQELLDSHAPYAIRLRIPENEIIELNDLIRGHVAVDSNLLDDKVLYKSDGMPTYHLANVVDDFLMQITHVIRGEEWLPSAPMHVLLYRYLGIEDKMPQFVHLPLLLKPDGKGKLSKRDGDRLGFPVFPLQWKDPKTGEISSGYRESGFYPEAFVNMLALLGWNPGTTQECFSLEELVENFSFDRVSKSGSKFDADKARWFNQQYLRIRSFEELAEQLKSWLQQRGINLGLDKLLRVIPLVADRVSFVHELWDQAWFFFFRPESYDSALIKKRWTSDTSEHLLWVSKLLATAPDFTYEGLSALVKEQIDERGLHFGSIMLPLRIVLVGSSVGPDLFVIMQHLGREETLSRIEIAIEKIKY